MISIVIPCYNNELQLTDTVNRIEASTKNLAHKFELILVDDGSADGTWTVVQNMAKSTESLIINGIRLETNIGAYHAIVPGMSVCKGDSVIVMAADGDDPPELIPELVSLFDSQTQLVLANKVDSKKGALSVFLSSVFTSTLKFLGAKNITSGGSDYMLFSRAILTKRQEIGWKKGNTLIQLIQLSQNAKTIDYTKGKSKPTSWTLSKKIALFWNTTVLFLPFTFLKSDLPHWNIRETC